MNCPKCGHNTEEKRYKDVREMHHDWIRLHKRATYLQYDNRTKRPLRAVYEFPEMSQQTLDDLNRIIDGPPSKEAVEEVTKIFEREQQPKEPSE